MNATALKSPFPYFGGKSSIVDRVWRLLGDPRNYVEPFAGSIAMLLRRPNVGQVETINDANHYVVNFWRAVTHEPENVAWYADSPVSEADLHARHLYLTQGIAYQSFSEQIVKDPDFFDAKFAGYWCWGQCCWIGGGWCTNQAMKADGEPKSVMPETDRRGVTQASKKVPMGSHGNSAFGAGVNGQSRQVPNLSGDAGATGRGVASSAGHKKRQRLACHDAPGVGVCSHEKRRPLLHNGNGINSGRPQLGDAFDIGRGVNGNKHLGLCDQRFEWLVDWFHRLADRLRLVRTCYGHWSRICDSNTTMTRLGTTGAFLDPPYAKNVSRVRAWIKHLQGDGPEPEQASSTNRASILYANDHSQDVDRLVAEVNLWCQRWGSDPNVRIVLCGYEGEHDNLVSGHGWRVEPWKAQGGYANRNADNQNKFRERLWISPACLNEDTANQQQLF